MLTWALSTPDDPAIVHANDYSRPYRRGISLCLTERGRVILESLMPSIFDLHVHTTQGSRDSALMPEEMIAEAARIGLHGVLLAEHEGWPRHEFDVWNAQRKDGLVVVRALE